MEQRRYNSSNWPVAVWPPTPNGSDPVPASGPEAHLHAQCTSPAWPNTRHQDSNLFNNLSKTNTVLFPLRLNHTLYLLPSHHTPPTCDPHAFTFTMQTLAPSFHIPSTLPDTISPSDYISRHGKENKTEKPSPHTKEQGR